MKVELEMDIEQEDGTAVLHKLSELANKAKELGFIVTEAGIERDDDEEDEDEEENEEENEGEEEQSK
jgi:hypothetical protein